MSSRSPLDAVGRDATSIEHRYGARSRSITALRCAPKQDHGTTPWVQPGHSPHSKYRPGGRTLTAGSLAVATGPRRGSPASTGAGAPRPAAAGRRHGQTRRRRRRPFCRRWRPASDRGSRRRSGGGSTPWSTRRPPGTWAPGTPSARGPRRSPGPLRTRAALGLAGAGHQNPLPGDALRVVVQAARTLVVAASLAGRGDVRLVARVPYGAPGW